MVMDKLLDNSQQGTGSSMITTRNILARSMDSNTGGTDDAAGTAKDDCKSSYNCGHAGHICHNCPKGDLMKKLLEQALVGKNALNSESGGPHKDE